MSWRGKPTTSAGPTYVARKINRESNKSICSAILILKWKGKGHRLKAKTFSMIQKYFDREIQEVVAGVSQDCQESL